MSLRAYITAANSNEILVLAMDPDSGVLTRRLQTVALTEVIGTKPPDSGIESIPIALTPDRRFLIICSHYEPYCLISLAVDQESGLLTPVGTTRIAGAMAQISTDRSGAFLLGASYSGNFTALYRIGDDGIIHPKQSQIVPFQYRVHAILSAPSNKFIYSIVQVRDAILWRRFEAATGRMIDGCAGQAFTEPGLGPRNFVFHPARPLLYVNTEQGGTLVVHHVDEDSGALTELQSISAMPDDFSGLAAAADLLITPDARFLYMSERRLNLIVGFSVDESTGRLSAVGRFPTETMPRGMATDPQGRHLIAVGQKSDHASVYSVNRENGTLNDRRRYPAGQNPGSVRIVEVKAEDRP